jgi:hypothetical protein
MPSAPRARITTSLVRRVGLSTVTDGPVIGRSAGDPIHPKPHTAAVAASHISCGGAHHCMASTPPAASTTAVRVRRSRVRIRSARACITFR